MRNLFFSLALLCASICGANAANGSEVNVLTNNVASVLAVSEQYAGTYAGTLYGIEMNGESGYEDQQMSFEITEAGYLYGQLAPIGEMPGTITINMPVSVDTNGNLTTNAGNDVVATLKMSTFPYMTINLYLNENGLSNASIENGELNFTLQVKGKFGVIDMFPATINFTGVKQ